MDLLGSILGSMEKPPSIGDEKAKKRAKGEGFFLFRFLFKTIKTF